MLEEIVKDEAAVVRLRVTTRLWKILQRHRISFGDRGPAEIKWLDLLKSAQIEQYTDYTNSNVLSTIGAFSYQRAHPLVLNMGRYCSVADNTWVMGERHPLEHVTTSSFAYRSPRPSFEWARQDLLEGSRLFTPPRVPTAGIPTFEHDVWTGNNVLLQRGITMHTGSVAGAGSVVTKDVPPYAIVVGNPAKIKRLRFPDRVIEGLLASKWWEYHPKILLENNRDPVRFLEELARRRSELPLLKLEVLSWNTLQPLLTS